MAYRFPYDGILVITKSVEQSQIVDAICCSTLFPYSTSQHQSCRPVIVDVRCEELIAIVMQLVNLRVGLPPIPLIIAHDSSARELIKTDDLLQKPDSIRLPYPP